jgi:hypothetical protein
VLVLLVVADRAAAAYAESQVESAVHDRLFVRTSAHIHSFPFLVRLGAAGQVSRLDVRLDDVLGHGIDLESIRFDADDVRLERGGLLHGDVQVTDVGSVRITARISEAAVRAVTHADVRLTNGRASVTVLGRTAGASLSVRGGRLRVGPVSVPLPDASLVPCAVDVRVVEGAIEASCVDDQLPPFVAQAVVSLR